MDVNGIFRCNGLFCVGNDIKFQSFQMQTCCVMYVHTGKCVLKKRTATKMNLPLRDDELFLIFLNKKRKKLTFWVHPILKRHENYCYCWQTWAMSTCVCNSTISISLCSQQLAH